MAALSSLRVPRRQEHPLSCGRLFQCDGEPATPLAIARADAV